MKSKNLHPRYRLHNFQRRFSHAVTISPSSTKIVTWLSKLIVNMVYCGSPHINLRTQSLVLDPDQAYPKADAVMAMEITPKIHAEWFRLMDKSGLKICSGKDFPTREICNADGPLVIAAIFRE